MSALAYLEPASVTEAAALLAEHGDAARLLAGGTAIVLLMQQKLIRPAVLISLERLDGIRSIAVDGAGTLHIGAMTALVQVATDPQVRQGWPLLADACAAVGNVRVRNQATLGGNLAEADYASDPPSALLALGAQVCAAGLVGERHIDLAEFLTGFYSTALSDNEILTKIIVPPQSTPAVSTYVKYKSRSAIDRPCVGVAALLAKEGDRCSMVRLAVGAACEVPQRFQGLEAQLAGQPLTPGVLEDFAGAYSAALPDPLDDLRGSSWYRREMTRIHVRRALSLLAACEETP